jgi:hypothetical protein
MRLTPRQLILIAAGVFVALLLFNRAGHSGAGSGAGDRPAAAASTTTDDGDVPITTSSLPATSSSSPAAPRSSATGDGDDGTDDTGPVLVQPTARPDVQRAAVEFVAAWLNTYGQSAESWREGLLPRVTAGLAADLADADPASVPAAAITGQVTVHQQESLVTADATVLSNDTKRTKLGIVSLTMLNEHGTWLVSQIDWTRAAR